MPRHQKRAVISPKLSPVEKIQLVGSGKFGRRGLARAGFGVHQGNRPNSVSLMFVHTTPIPNREASPDYRCWNCLSAAVDVAILERILLASQAVWTTSDMELPWLQSLQIYGLLIVSLRFSNVLASAVNAASSTTSSSRSGIDSPTLINSAASLLCRR